MPTTRSKSNSNTTRSKSNTTRSKSNSNGSKSNTTRSKSNTLEYINNIKIALYECGFDDVEIGQTYDSDEHGFKFKPTKFKSNGDGKFYIIKPRPAKLDKNIIELFKKINKVNTNSNGVKLPYYNITTCNNYSIWDFIEGNLVTTLRNTTNFNTSTSAIEQEQRGLTIVITEHPKRIENLEYLNTVSSLIGLTDLHSDNVILLNDMYYPIDLEIINKTNITGLYGSTEKGIIKKELLNHKSLNLIKEFNNNLHLFPNRFLPSSTVDFIKYINDDNVYMKQIVSSFTKNKNEKYINTTILKKYLLSCKTNRIVPYFLKENNDIFFYNFKDHKYSKIRKDCKKLTKKKCIYTKECEYNKKKSKCVKVQNYNKIDY